MNKKFKVFNLLLLDESGSMSSIEKSTISSFNEIVETIQKAEELNPDQEHFITFATFSCSDVKYLQKTKPVKELQKIDFTSYQPAGSTPLYDAIGKTCTHLDVETEGMENFTVLVTIFTDGIENSSRIFNSKSIQNLIEKLKKSNWVFTYIGANHDVERTSLDLRINNFVSYKANDEGVKNVMEKEKNSRLSFMSKIGKETFESISNNYFADFKDSNDKA